MKQLAILLTLLVACGDDSSSLDGGDATDVGLDVSLDAPGRRDSPDADDVGDVGVDAADAADAVDVGSLVLLTPVDGDDVNFSRPFRFTAPAGATTVRVEGGDASCEAEAPFFECLLDLSSAEAGGVEVTSQAFIDSEPVADPVTITLNKRAIDNPCGDNVDECVVSRAEAGVSAGFDGVSYLNADDRHANVVTTGMTGIDARVYAQPPNEPESDVALGLMNESRAYTSGGSCSLVRCYRLRRGIALRSYANNVLYFIPEHRDVGIRDYFMWQAPFIIISQGSSSSERDEVAKGLRALGLMADGPRDEAESANLIAPLVWNLLLRGRVESDTDFLSSDAFPTALTNTQSADRIFAMASSIRVNELPPVALLTNVESSFPSSWGMDEVFSEPSAAAFAPLTLPTEVPTGDFEVIVDLEPADAAGHTLSFFPVVLRDGQAGVTVERSNAAGTRWTLRGTFPTDETITTGGQDRINARASVAFVPHNGFWLGTPVMVSVGGREAEELSSNSNNLD